MSHHPSPKHSAEQQGGGSGQRLGVKGDRFHTVCQYSNTFLRKGTFDSISVSGLNGTNVIKPRKKGEFITVLIWKNLDEI